jgi:hypothetical protein
MNLAYLKLMNIIYPDYVTEFTSFTT